MNNYNDGSENYNLQDEVTCLRYELAKAKQVRNRAERDRVKDEALARRLDVALHEARATIENVKTQRDEMVKGYQDRLGDYFTSIGELRSQLAQALWDYKQTGEEATRNLVRAELAERRLSTSEECRNNLASALAEKDVELQTIGHDLDSAMVALRSFAGDKQ